jgi:transaldolase/glucose-6-phosphate isomerase
MNSVEKLYQYGQSIWYDNIQRKLLTNGELEGMIKRHEIFGVTSNPSIFQNAIAKSTDYDNALNPMAWSGWSAEEIFWELAIEDIRAAADLFKPLYDETDGGDGYVSLEVNPQLAHDSESTYQEAMRLWQRVDRENLMVKIPATKEGLPAIRKCICAGLNINVTLIFSLERYREVIEAYICGLEDRLKEGKQLENIASVASFFVSRVDSKVDPQLQKIIENGSKESAVAQSIIGHTAVFNVKLAYEIFKKTFSTERFQKLANDGAKIQRPLWASTSTKNPSYRDVIYIEELIGPDTVNTVPPKTLTAFIDHGKVENTVGKDLDEAKKAMESLESLGISMTKVTSELEEEGVKSFADAFSSLLESIQEKAGKAKLELGNLNEAVKRQVDEFDKISAVRRLFEVDPSLWTNDPAGQEEIRKRANWLNAPWSQANLDEEFASLRKHCQAKGFTKAVLLGMGGSSLAPEVLRMINGITGSDDYVGLDLEILDSTDPGQVSAVSESSPIERTLFIVSSKSGGTAEVNAFLDYFWAKTQELTGKKAGEHFIAITDPGTKLEALAKEKGFFQIFSGDPMVGGRNSALTAFGLVPASLIGMDVEKLLENARKTAEKCLPEVPGAANPGLLLGAIIGTAWKEGKDKLTILTDSNWTPFGSWLEQLIAESSGKQGKGILPVVGEPELDPKSYKNDRLFVYLNSSNEKSRFVEDLRMAGHPVIELSLQESYDLGGQFYLWEVATAIACIILEVNPFDQPDVQDNKTRTLSKIDEYKKNGKLSEETPGFDLPYARIYANPNLLEKNFESLHDVLIAYLKKVVKAGDYIAINAYRPRNQHNIDELTMLRKSLLEQFHLATTLGFGPRFLHSTGQLHKGGADNGVFIQITADVENEIDIPGEGISFGILEKAQHLGDFEALKARGRRVIRIHLKKPDHIMPLK